MYRNLKAEMARNDVTARELAKRVGMTEASFSLKMHGKRQFSIYEAKRIRRVLGTDVELEELFED